MSRSSRARRVRNGAWPSRRFLPDSLALIDSPVAIVAGAADEVVSVKRNAEFFAAKIPRAQLTILVFTGHCLEAGRTALPRVCNDPPGSTAPPSRRRPPAWRRRCLRSPRGKPDYPVEGRQKLAVSTAGQAGRTQSPAGRVAPKEHDEPVYAVAGLGRRAARTVAAGRCAAH